MARKYVFFPGELHLSLKRVKHILLSLGLAVMLAVFQPMVSAQTSSPQQAQALIDQGKQQLAQGYPSAAIDTWQKAAKLYQKINDAAGVTGSLINQSAALQAMGEYRRACTTLSDALSLDEAICPSTSRPNLPPKQVEELVGQSLSEYPVTSLQVLGLRNLGEVFRQLSQPENAETALQQGLAVSTQLNPSADPSGLLLALGNTHKTFYSRAKGQYSNLNTVAGQQSTTVDIIRQESKKALNFYQKATGSPTPTTSLAAQFNSLNLLVDLDQWTASQAPYGVIGLQALYQEIHPQIWPMVQQLQKTDLMQLPKLEQAKSSLSFASSLLKLYRGKEQVFPQAAPLGIEYALEALQIGKALGNRRIQSAAAGILAGFSKDQGNIPEARQQFAAALGWAQSTEAWDLAYQWQEEMGRLFEESGNIAGALSYYRASVTSLEQVRGGLLSFDPEYQFSFKEKVEPIYQEYMRLLFDADSPNYEEILRVNEQLRLAELENYLQCGKLNLVSPTELRGNRPTFIYVLDLGDRFEEIVLSPDGKLNHHTPDSTILRKNADFLLTYLSDRILATTPEVAYQPYAQALYEQLIAPIKSYLPASGTLVFSLDTALQGIPMELLYDGESYLLEHYSTSLTLGSQIRPPQILEPGNLKVLLAGLSKVSPSFQLPEVPSGLQPLPDVQAEIQQIKAVATEDKELLNQVFTRQRFQELLGSGSFPLVHVATHGQFSSDPGQTLFLAWDSPINVSQFNSLLNRKQGNQLSLELLTLSACETALGDKRSALGLAGVAAQAGARSTLASLWLVDEASTAELMTKFYKNLRAGMTKAEAKRQAQLFLRNNPETANPYLWAAFVLVGGWL